MNPAFGLQLHHLRFLEFVGAPESARLLYRSPTFWMDQLGEEQAMAAGSQPATGRGHYIVKSSDTVAVRDVATPNVVGNDAPWHGTDGVSYS